MLMNVQGALNLLNNFSCENYVGGDGAKLEVGGGKI
jgi:hypothetical protein